MNSKGFGIPQIMLFGIFTFLVIYIFGSFISTFSNSFESKSAYKYTKNVYSKYIEKSAIEKNTSYQNYEDIEKSVASAMLKYIENNKIELGKDETVSKNLDYFITNNYLKNINDITNNSVYCEAYALAEYINSVENKYSGFISCGNYYITTGFDKKYLQKN